jgi:hypothetical protein
MSTGFFLAVLGLSLAIALFATIVLQMRMGKKYDRLVEIFYLSHRDEWEKADRPFGMWWRPPGNVLVEPYWYGSKLTGTKFLYLWFFKTPKWVANDDDARQAIAHFRSCFVVWAISFATMVVIIFLWCLLVFSYT